MKPDEIIQIAGKNCSGKTAAGEYVFTHDELLWFVNDLSVANHLVHPDETTGGIKHIIENGPHFIDSVSPLVKAYCKKEMMISKITELLNVKVREREKLIGVAKFVKPFDRLPEDTKFRHVKIDGMPHVAYYTGQLWITDHGDRYDTLCVDWLDESKNNN